MAGLLDKRLWIVSGKGGVGKSTIAAALALRSARAGKRTLVCEINTQERISRLLGHERVLNVGQPLVEQGEPVQHAPKIHPAGGPGPQRCGSCHPDDQHAEDVVEPEDDYFDPVDEHHFVEPPLVAQRLQRHEEVRDDEGDER